MSRKTRHRKMKKRQHKRSRKIQRAGAYIYEGAYGCGFSNPPLKCRDEPARRGDTIVTKAMRRTDADEELADGAKFQAIDPTKRHFLWPERVCEYDNTDVTPANQIDRCSKLAGPAPTATHLLLSENGGQNLHLIKPKLEDVAPFLESLINLFDGLILAHTNNIAHCDIKPANIVSMKREDGTFHTRYIDFGFSTKFDALDPFSDFDRYDSGYVYWPMETRFYSAYYIDSKGNREKVIRDFYLNLGAYVKSCIPLNSYYYQNGTEMYDEDSLRQVVAGLDLNDTRRTLPWLDIYSLGLTIAQVYFKCVPHTIKYKSDGSLYAEIPLKLYLATTEPNLQEIIDWNILVQDRISIPLAHLIGAMIHINPLRRPTLTNAKLLYTLLAVQMKALLKKDMLYKTQKIIGKLGEMPNPPTPTPFVASPVNLGRIAVTPVNVPVRPKRDPRNNIVFEPSPSTAPNENFNYMFNSP